jgi:putative transferase (TIGR04331 family)
VLAAIPRYSYHLYSIPVAGQFNGYLDDQICFAGALDESIRNDLAIRLHHLDYGWDVADRLADAGLGALLDQETKPFHRALCESRLCVSTYNATTYLETLAANFPTMIFWKSAHWELRDSALPFFEVLKEVGIFHTSPESAALFLNRIQDSVEQWWWSTDVQQARRNFVHEFARLDTDWKNQWLAGVKSILNEQSQRHDG